MKLTIACRAILATTFGAAITLSFLAGWLYCGRALTGPTALAAIFFLAGGALSAGAAMAAVRWLAARHSTARLAAAFLCLLVGTFGLASLFATIRGVAIYHDITRLPFRLALLILAVSTAGDAYNTLSIAAPLTLPLGLPLIGLFAFLIARDAR